MEKEFIPYEQALELKQLGLNLDYVFGFYSSRTRKLLWLANENPIINSIPAPLYQQAFKWFREKYDLDSHIKKDWTDGLLYGYEAIIECEDGLIDVGTFKTPEEAELECLKKLIEIVKNEK